MTITPLGPTTGVEIAGLSGRQLVDRVVADRCRAALNEYGVVIYREVDVDDEGLVAFSRLLGDVVPLPRGGHELPEIQTITRDPARSELAACGDASASPDTRRLVARCVGPRLGDRIGDRVGPPVRAGHDAPSAVAGFKAVTMRRSRDAGDVGAARLRLL